MRGWNRRALSLGLGLFSAGGLGRFWPASALAAGAQPLPLGEGLFSSGQISLAEPAKLKAAGFASILNMRPDGEAAGQPSSEAMASAARAAGLAYDFAPISKPVLNPDEVRALAARIAALPRPALLYCNSGSRVTRVWAQTQGARKDGLAPEAILAVARMNGYRIDDLMPEIVRQASRRSP